MKFVLVLPSEDPKKAKEQIQGLLKTVIDTNLLPFLSEEEENPYIGIKLDPVEKALILHIQIREALTQIFSDPINKVDEIKSLFDEDFYIFLRFVLKTNFNIDDLLQKSTLIEGLLKGFELQLSGQAPNSMLKKFREVVEANQTEGASLNFLLSVLLRNAFLRLKLRSPLMVEKFFEKIGIKEILNECPTLSELLEQLSLMPDLQKVKYDVHGAGHLVYQALKLFKSNFESGVVVF